MSTLRDLLRRVGEKNPELAAEIEAEVRALESRRAFGLNFERHTPESVELPGRPVRRGDKVRFMPERGEAASAVDQRLWQVAKIRNAGGKREADLVRPSAEDEVEHATREVEDLVVVAEFRDPIYPGLVSTGKVERGGDKPFHTVINAENYHALQALLYTHAGKVDAIYIDPPYNTRDKDWKYNNDYVDKEDQYKHSKWLAMMERRLRFAVRLLDPKQAVLIVTIDANELYRLVLLIEQTIPAARIRMISSVINSKGVGVTEGFKRVDEYVVIARIGDAGVYPSTDAPLGSRPIDADVTANQEDDDEPKRIKIDWQTARRRDLQSVRPTRPAQFYPQRPGCIAVFPVRDDGTEMNWAVTGPTFQKRWRKGYARAGKAMPGKPQKYIIQYLKSGPIADIEEGRAIVEGRNNDGSVVAYYESESAKAPPTQWNLRSHNAEHYGTRIVRSLLPGRQFPFPKSLFAVEDVLRLFISEKRDAVVLDFFAGSGTSAHAVMRLNKQDGGCRQCISVTNNEVSADEQKGLREKGLRPGDPEWEQWGICDHITKPRIKAAITGKTPGGEPIKGDYKFTDEFPMADGFEENVEFFTMTYEAPRRVAHHRSFAAIAPLLWLKAGARGRRVEQAVDDFAVVEAYGVLFNPDCSQAFVEALAEQDDARMAFVVTDDDRAYQAVCKALPEDVEPVRLYASYLTSFTINTGRE